MNAFLTGAGGALAAGALIFAAGMVFGYWIHREEHHARRLSGEYIEPGRKVSP